MTRPSACRRGYDRTWRRIRAEAIERQPYCSMCGSTANLQGDHILPISRGGLSTRANCQVLCATCNGRKAGRIARTQLTLDSALGGIWAAPRSDAA